jgi:hypothetical protein
MNSDYIERAELFASIKNELDNEQKMGILLTVEGRKRTPEYIAGICVFREECNYMRDYIMDENGQVIEIGFNNVKDR